MPRMIFHEGHGEILENIDVLEDAEHDRERERYEIDADEFIDRAIKKGKITPVLHIIDLELRNNMSVILGLDFYLEDTDMAASGIVDINSFNKAERGLLKIRNSIVSIANAVEGSVYCAEALKTRVDEDSSLLQLFTPQAGEYLESIRNLRDQFVELVTDRADYINHTVTSIEMRVNNARGRFID